MSVTEHHSALSDLLKPNGSRGSALAASEAAKQLPADDSALYRVEHLPRHPKEGLISPIVLKLWAVMKKAAFFGAILGCLVMFACGAGLCCFLLVTYWLAPAQASFQRELFFDYTQTEAVATAQLCPAVPTQGVVRVLKPGQQANIWLELVMPEENGDVFQVAAALLTQSGRTIESTSKPCLVPRRSQILQYARMLLRLPLVLIGWDKEQQVVKLPLFKRFRERADMPFCIFKAALQAHARGGEWPRLYSAIAHVDLDLGLIGRALYWVRPSGWTRRIMWGIALIAMMGSCFTMGVLWLLYALIRPMDLKSKDATKDMRLGLSDEEVSSEEGASDLATGDLDSQSEKDGVESADGGSATMSPLNETTLKRWDQNSMSQQSGSSDGYLADHPYINGKKLN